MTATTSTGRVYAAMAVSRGCGTTVVTRECYVPATSDQR